MKKLLLLLVITTSFAGCMSERQKQASARRWDEARIYTITLYSGGTVVFRDTLSGIVNQEEGSDGIFYYKGDSLVEISGDVVVKSVP